MTMANGAGRRGCDWTNAWQTHELLCSSICLGEVSNVAYW
jgi:hypothetical protein